MPAKTVAILAMAMASVVAIAAALSYPGDTRTLRLGGAAIAALHKGEEDNPAKEVAGSRGEGDRGPAEAAEEKYANRAYPADSVPVAATQNAISTFQQINNGQHQAGSWELLGPTQTAFQPGVLSFTGADSVTSGRITALAVKPGCGAQSCTLYAAAAGGGIWRTNNALSTSAPSWRFISGALGSNAIGTMIIDPTDASGQTLYVGTGEPNASGDSEAGVGVYKSTNGGSSWSLLAGSAFANARSVSSIVIDQAHSGTIYVATTRGVRGVSSVTGGATSNPPGAAPFGLYRSTDGGATFTFIWNGAGTLRGVNHFEIDSVTGALYAAAFQKGLYRSTNGGATFNQVFAPTSPALNTDRTEFALTVKSGHTRIYLGDGAQGRVVAPTGTVLGVEASFWRTDAADTLSDAALLASGWKSLTSSDRTNPYYATFNYCTGQCWYDNVVATPAGFPDVVFVAGSFLYGELGGRSNARAVLRSTTAGEPDAANGDRTFTDMTNDASSNVTPNGIHPDQHALAFLPGNPNVWFNGSDGGVVRSSGSYANISAQCDTRGLSVPSLVACHRLLSAVPTRLYGMNKGLSTLQFQSVSVNPANPRGEVMGGTQDNGTWLFKGNRAKWNQSIYGDGGQSGFNVANPTIRFNTFFGEYTDANFRGGDPEKWVVISGPLVSSPEGSAFYMPLIADPKVAGSLFAGLERVWRTKDNGGDRDYLEANCPEFTTDGGDPKCGDWVPLGTTRLNSTALGTRAGGVMAAVERTTKDNGTLWAATSTGRVFITKNVDAATASSVTFTRLDALATNSPGRFVSSIYVDPQDANHAWISYSGYRMNTPTTPGHVFEVHYDKTAGTATWTDLNIEGVNGDLPVTDLVRDDLTGDLYAATDFGVLSRNAVTGTWAVAGDDLPVVEVAGLTISSSARVLYAATHGRSVWKLDLNQGAGQTQ